MVGANKETAATEEGESCQRGDSASGGIHESASHEGIAQPMRDKSSDAVDAQRIFNYRQSAEESVERRHRKRPSLISWRRKSLSAWPGTAWW
jgi:hypothetical protein